MLSIAAGYAEFTGVNYNGANVTTKRSNNTPGAIAAKEQGNEEEGHKGQMDKKAIRVGE